jgi:hypothetical protein
MRIRSEGLLNTLEELRIIMDDMRGTDFDDVPGMIGETLLHSRSLERFHILVHAIWAFRFKNPIIHCAIIPGVGVIAVTEGVVMIGNQRALRAV